jgi:hypothetical protein
LVMLAGAQADMTDFIANGDEDRRDPDEILVETEWRGSENQVDGWRAAEDRNAPPEPVKPPTARLGWGWAILIIAALSVVAWVAVVLIVIVALLGL